MTKKIWLLLFVFPHIVSAQKDQFEIKSTFYYGKSLIKPTVQKVHPTAPFFVDLVVTEPTQQSLSFDVMYSKSINDRWRVDKGFEVSSFSFLRKFDFDREASISEIASECHKFSFLSLKTIFFRSLMNKRLRLSVGAGPSLDYLIKSDLTYEYIKNGQAYGGTADQLDNKRFNLSGKFYLDFSVPITDFMYIEVQPAYFYYLGKIDPEGKRVSSYYLGVGVGLKI